MISITLDLIAFTTHSSNPWGHVHVKSDCSSTQSTCTIGFGQKIASAKIFGKYRYICIDKPGSIMCRTLVCCEVIYNSRLPVPLFSTVWGWINKYKKDVGIGVGYCYMLNGFWLSLYLPINLNINQWLILVFWRLSAKFYLSNSINSTAVSCIVTQLYHHHPK